MVWIWTHQEKVKRIFNRVPQPLQSIAKSLANHPVNSVPVGLDDITASWAQLPDVLTPPMKAAQEQKIRPASFTRRNCR